MSSYVIIPLQEKYLDRIISRKNDLVKYVESILPASKVENATRRFDQKLEEIRQIMEDCALLDTRLGQTLPSEQIFERLGELVRCQNIDVNYVRCIQQDTLPKVPLKEVLMPPVASSHPDSTEVPNSSDDAIIAPLSLVEFDSIPKYMRGRIRCIEVNEIINKFNEFLLLKRRLLNAPFRKLRKEEKDLVWQWKVQVTSVISGELFCQEKDIKPSLKSRTQALFRTIVPCLRHVRRIKEVRDKGQIYYVPL